MEEKALLVTLNEQAASIGDSVSSYLTTFNGDGVLRLFESESDKSKYAERYSAFSLKLTSALSLLEASMAELSKRISEYEALGEYDKLETLCPVFESCEEFFSVAAGFVEKNEKNFMHKANSNPVLALNYARELKLALENFIKKING